MSESAAEQLIKLARETLRNAQLVGVALPCRRANAISAHLELVDRQQQLTQSLPRPLSSFIVPLRFAIMHPSIAISLRRFVLSFLHPSGLASLRRLEHI